MLSLCSPASDLIPLVTPGKLGRTSTSSLPLSRMSAALRLICLVLEYGHRQAVLHGPQSGAFAQVLGWRDAPFCTNWSPFACLPCCLF